jgi:hypothetical protein
MITLAAAAVLVRDLTEQHLDGATPSAPAGRSRQAPPNGNANARQPHAAPRAKQRAVPSGQGAVPSLPRSSGACRRSPRSA